MKSELIQICDANEISEGEIKSFDTSVGFIAVTKIGDEFFAFEDVCTHDGECISTGHIDGEAIVCPRHFARFNMKTGEVLAMPATSPLITFPVKLNKNKIEIEVEN